MGVKLSDEGLTRQPAQVKHNPRPNAEHPWRRDPRVFSEKEKEAKKRAYFSRPTAQPGRNRDTLQGQSKRVRAEPFVCVSCGMADCVGGECTARW
jgi:hypothetical protein